MESVLHNFGVCVWEAQGSGLCDTPPGGSQALCSKGSPLEGAVLGKPPVGTLGHSPAHDQD